MKHIVLIIALLLLTAHSGFGQVKQRPRSPFFQTFTSVQHPAEGSRGAAPANDDCMSAQTIPVTADCSAPVEGTNVDATDVGPDVSCDDPGSELLDVWYTFNSSDEDTVAIMLTPSAQMTDWDLVVYDACGGNQVICSISPATPLNVPVSPNTDYWIRVYSNTSYGDPGPFTLCVSRPAHLAAPANDVCADVAPQALAVGGTLTFNGTNIGANDNEGFGYPAVWESFSLSTCADVKISYCGTAPAWHGFWTLLYTGCPPSLGVFVGSYDSTACGDGNFTLCYAHLPAGDYHYPLLQTVLSLGTYTLNVSAVACGADEAVNDECAGAIPIVAQPTCAPTSFVAPCATQSMPAVTCGTSTGDAADDVWYKFVATSTDMTVGGAPHGNMDIVMELFSGTCGSLTSVACGDVGGSGVPDDMIATGLAVGNTYHFRVYDFRTQYAYAEPGYDLCLVDGQGSGVGVQEVNADDEGVALFPNPNTGAFTIRADHRAAQVRCIISDATGRVIVQRNVQASNGQVIIDARGSLAQGHYIVRCNDGVTTSTHRLIVN